ncbi:MAG TPA: DUF5985 family protein [Candidatus Binataceae bacterium]|nr:DUF5985 family protein [Candidatus Binataceae bacterium]
MGFAVAGLFFLRFWNRTRDIFFGLFAGAFWLFALNTAIIALFGVEENHIFAYLLRLVGFTLIIGAVFTKNSRSEAYEEELERDQRTISVERRK